MAGSMRVYLVVGADRTTRVAKRPHIRSDEVAVAVTIDFPDSWGRIVDSIHLAMPDPPSVNIEQPNGEGS